MVTIKRRFDPERETLDEMIDGVYGLLQPARRGVESTSDKETRLLLRLPNVAHGRARARRPTRSTGSGCCRSR